MVSAIAVPVSASVSTAASADSGRRTVRDCTIGSYCSNTQRLEAIVGEPSSASSTSVGPVAESVVAFE